MFYLSLALLAGIVLAIVFVSMGRAMFASLREQEAREIAHMTRRLPCTGHYLGTDRQGGSHKWIAE